MTWNGESVLPVSDLLREHEVCDSCISVSDDGKLIVSVSNSKTVRLWNGESGSPVGNPLPENKGYVNCVAVSVYGKIIVSGCRLVFLTG